MSMLQRRIREKTAWEPADYTANETANVFNVAAGDIATGICFSRVTEVFNGSGTDAVIIVGDGDDDNGLLAAGNIDETATGIYIGGGAYFATRPKLYTAADTVDIGFTANTAGTRTTGIIDLYVEIARAFPS